MRFAISMPVPHRKPRARTSRRCTVTALAACVLVLLVGPAAAADHRPLAVATISILADFVRAVAGDRLEVVSIVHVGGDPHTYEPVPSDARRIADADLVVRNGLGLERWLDRLIATSAAARVVTATEGLPAVLLENGTYRGHPDPHLWMDPLHATAYVRNIQAALTERYPLHGAEFAERAERYVGRLEALDREIAGAPTTHSATSDAATTWKSSPRSGASRPRGSHRRGKSAQSWTESGSTAFLPFSSRLPSTPR